MYGIDRTDVADSMQELLGFVSTTVPSIMKKAFDCYRKTNLDFVDCILASYNLVEGKEILSFDKKLNNFIANNKG